MRNRLFIAIALLSVAALPLAGQTAKSAIPRMPDGHPDLQGTYDLATITPLERLPGDPPFLTQEKAEALRKAERILLQFRDAGGKTLLKESERVPRRYVPQRVNEEMVYRVEQRFFPDALENQNFRIDRHTDGEDDTGDAGQGQSCAEVRERRHQQQRWQSCFRPDCRRNIGHRKYDLREKRAPGRSDNPRLWRLHRCFR